MTYREPIIAEEHTRVSIDSTLSRLLSHEGYQELERITRIATSKDQVCEGKLGLLFKYGQELNEDDVEELDVAITEWIMSSRPDLMELREGKQGPLLPDGRFYSKRSTQD